MNGKKTRTKKHDVYVEKKAIYKIILRPAGKHTHDSAWIVDGELGKWQYPGTWPESTARSFYEHGWPFHMNLGGCRN